MERAAFLIEPGGQRVDCMLNPQSLTIQRRAGVVAQRGGAIAGAGVSDDLLRATGGGTTEFSLQLLFDTELSPNREAMGVDVRSWTRPLWDLCENRTENGSLSAPAAARFLFGKTWNLRVAVLAASERFGEFTPAGVPRRSWLSLLLQRVPEDPLEPASIGGGSVATDAATSDSPLPASLGMTEGSEASESLNSVDLSALASGRPDLVAHSSFGCAARWREVLALPDVIAPADAESEGSGTGDLEGGSQ